MKSILVGNGFNIQFGGVAYSSEYIMKRIQYKNLFGGYQELFSRVLKDSEIQSILLNFVSVANEIRNGLYDSYSKDSDTQNALLDYKKRYKCSISEPYHIMLEDWFFIIHMFLQKNDDIPDKGAVKLGFERLILDGIYNGGMIQELYQKFPKTLKKFLSEYDHIFTLNYDNNLELSTGNTVYHLHGSFSVISQENKTVAIPGYEHCFCNALLHYSGELKYRNAKFCHAFIELPAWHKKVTEYYFDLFENIEGELHIIGMSPNNDDHIFKCIIGNKKISKVVFYYHSIEQKEYIESTFDKRIFECADVKKLWKDLKCEEKKYSCNHNLPSDIDNLISVMNVLSKDLVTKEQVFENINRIPQFEAIRLGKLVIQDIKRRNPHNTPTTQKEFEKTIYSSCYIALQEGVLPSTLFLLVIMYFDKIK